jgi:hypothetical protein
VNEIFLQISVLKYNNLYGSELLYRLSVNIDETERETIAACPISCGGAVFGSCPGGCGK